MVGSCGRAHGIGNKRIDRTGARATEEVRVLVVAELKLVLSAA
jgi:hypothetical protein